MNSAPGTPSTSVKRSLAVPVAVGLVLAAVVAACMYYFTEVRSKPASPASQARWHGFQQEHNTQSSAAQQAFEQHNAMMAARKNGAGAHKSPAASGDAPSPTKPPK